MGKFIVALVLLVLTTAVGVLLIARGRTPSSSPTPSNTPHSTSVSTDTASLDTLETLDPNQRCTFADEESATSGSLLVGEGKTKADFTTSSEGTTVNGHVLLEENDIYIWLEGAAEGFKTTKDAIKELSETAPALGLFSPDREVEYTCIPQVVSESDLTAPDIEFNDYSDFLKSLPSTIPM